jgi:hypothetical protein
MTANLLVRHKEAVQLGTMSLVENGQNQPILDNFKSARALLERIKRVIALPGQEIRLAEVRSLQPLEVHDWYQDKSQEGETLLRFHITLVPSPGAWLYSGGDSMVPPVGQIVLINHRAYHSMINFGTNAAIFLEVTLGPDTTPTPAEV